MSPRPAAGGARRLAGALEVAAAVLAGAAVAAAFAGPIRLALGDATLSVRTLARPLGLGAAVLLLRLWLARRELVVVPAIAGRVGLGAIITASVLGWTIFLSPTVGGVDSYGYVSTATRLLHGSLIEHEPLAAAMPFPNGIAAATLLGHVPSPHIADASVPLYPWDYRPSWRSRRPSAAQPRPSGSRRSPALFSSPRSPCSRASGLATAPRRSSPRR